MLSRGRGINRFRLFAFRFNMVVFDSFPRQIVFHVQTSRREYQFSAA